MAPVLKGVIAIFLSIQALLLNCPEATSRMECARAPSLVPPPSPPNQLSLCLQKPQNCPSDHLLTSCLYARHADDGTCHP